MLIAASVEPQICGVYRFPLAVFHSLSRPSVASRSYLCRSI